MKRLPVFSWSVWRWTGPTENLYDLDAEALHIFKALCAHAP